MNPQNIYEQRVENFRTQLKIQKSKLLTFSLLRLGVFIIALAGVYWFWSTPSISVSIAIAFCFVFVFLVKTFLEIKRQKTKLIHLITINTNEIKFLKGDKSIFNDGEAHKDGLHAFSEDIDLFGKNSFFHFLNRTGIQNGEKLLAKLLKINDTTDIRRKQEAIKELSEKIDFRQNFTAEAYMLEDQDSVPQIIRDFENHSSFSKSWIVPVSYVFSMLSLVVILAFGFEYLNINQLGLWILLGLGITGIFLKRINRLSKITSSAQEIFRQYQKLIEAVENEDFQSKHLVLQQKKLVSNKGSASKAIKQLSKYIDALEQRQNMLVGFVLNALSLWDLRQCKRIEDWLFKYKDEIRQWFEVIDHIDAQNSFANMAFNQQEYAFPEIDENQKFILDCRKAAHPLINPKQVVKNDFSIGEEDFLIITGANMAGKSTFLRTVSLMIVMANNGLPLCAESCTYKPIKLITSMRTSDSLSDDSSYFYAELSRLKVIIDKISTDTYFIVLDEILKGTNSHDKAKGSKQFVERLVKSKSSGIIATHDLSLCTLEESLASVTNYYFDAEILNDELHFDYTLKKGICQNMNASFLLKKMGIV